MTLAVVIDSNVNTNGADLITINPTTLTYAPFVDEQTFTVTVDKNYKVADGADFQVSFTLGGANAASYAALSNLAFKVVDTVAGDPTVTVTIDATKVTSVGVEDVKVNPSHIGTVYMVAAPYDKPVPKDVAQLKADYAKASKRRSLGEALSDWESSAWSMTTTHLSEGYELSVEYAYTVGEITEDFDELYAEVKY